MGSSIQKDEDGMGFAKKIIFEVNNKIKRVYWTNEEIDKWFGKRSAKEIINNGTTCFMNSCLDVTLVSASIIYSKNIPYTLVIEEHLPTKEFKFNRLHFVLEFEYDKNKYFLNYKRCNDVYIYEGVYNGRRDIPFAQIMRIPGKKINPNKSLHENLNYNNLEDLLKKEFRDYSLKTNLMRLKQDNSKENYYLFKQKYGENFIIKQLESQPST